VGIGMNRVAYKSKLSFIYRKTLFTPYFEMA